MTYRLAARKLRPGREIVVAPYDAGPLESLAGIEPGDSMTTRDLLYGLMLPSGNDAAFTLAIAVAGSEADFVARMNREADRLGLEETTYTDPIGLDSGNVSSARDLVDLTVVLREDPLFRKIVDTEERTLGSGADPIRVVNRNDLVLRVPFVNGVKTGTTLSAGYVLVASGKQRGVQLTSALLGADNEATRDAGMLRLLDYGFSLYDRRRVVRRGETIASVPITDDRGELDLVAGGSLTSVARKDQRAEFSFEAPASVEGPIAEGEALGTTTVNLGGKLVGSMDVVAASAVGEPPGDLSVGGLPSWAVVVLTGAALVAILLGGLAVVNARGASR